MNEVCPLCKKTFNSYQQTCFPYGLKDKYHLECGYEYLYKKVKEQREEIEEYKTLIKMEVPNFLYVRISEIDKKVKEQ